MTAQTILPANTLSSGYDVANSVRLAGDAYGQKSISSSGSGTTATFSAWIKPSVTPDKALFTSYIDSNNYVEIYFSSGQFRVFHYDGGSTSNDAVQFLNNKNIKSIIIDHHEINKPFPKTNVIINPKKNINNKYNYLCATTLTYFFIDKLSKKVAWEKLN